MVRHDVEDQAKPGVLQRAAQPLEALPPAERPAAYREWRDDFRIRRIVRARRLSQAVMRMVSI